MGNIDSIDGRPLFRLVFDADGDIDPATSAALTDGIRESALTDLVIFSHGWNNDEAAATSLYERWFKILAQQLDPSYTVGFVGLRWPSQLWRDEPIPDFPDEEAGEQTDDAAGAVALAQTPTFPAGPPTLDDAQLADLKEMFPGGSADLDVIAGLLSQPPSAVGATQMFAALRAFNAHTNTGFSDGEADPAAMLPPGTPGMLDPQRNPVDVFTKFGDRLADAGVTFGGDGGGAAGLGDLAGKVWQGAKEALRQLSYWQMKNRAGVVGRNGLGPEIDRLADEYPALRFHLVGHSFGGRLVSYALAGMRDRKPSPVKAVTLMEAAYSRFAFADRLPFRQASGALAGCQNRVDGPVAICFSRYDRALSTFYPLASAAAGDDAAGLDDPLFRWRAMGSMGAYRAVTQPLGDDGVPYRFQPRQLFNLDASAVVKADAGPSGAHSDIFHSELSWVTASAGGLNKP